MFYLCEFHELRHVVEVSHESYLDTAHEVDRLGSYLDAVEVALKASGRETTIAQVVAANVQACIVVECTSSASWFPISFHGH
jgi:hypothetical protein